MFASKLISCYKLKSSEKSQYFYWGNQDEANFQVSLRKHAIPVAFYKNIVNVCVITLPARGGRQMAHTAGLGQLF